MKTEKKDGYYLIILSEEEMNQWIGSGSENSNHQANVNPLKGLRKNTVDFYHRLKNKFGTNVKINWKEPYVIETKRELYVNYNALNSLKQKGLIEIVKKMNNGSGNVDHFTILF